MIDLSNALDFEGYLNKNNEEEREKLIEAYERTELSRKAVEAVNCSTCPMRDSLSLRLKGLRMLWRELLRFRMWLCRILLA